MSTKRTFTLQDERLLWCLLCCLIIQPLCAKQVLVFGGNGFLGASTVEKFTESDDNVTIVSRGNWYWDSKSRILPKVVHIPCDRSKQITECPNLTEFVDTVDLFDLVVDFSAFSGHEIKEAESVLKNKVGLYIYISSDSIYDVCDKTHTGPSKETDAIRPESDDEIELNKQYHSYGHRKLEAEEELMSQRMHGGFPFVILRLPDVIGPRDTTYRWWIYQLWLKVATELKEKPVLVPHFLKNYRMSFVYSEDVSEVIHQLPGMGPQIKDQAINLAYEQTVTLPELLADMTEALEIETDDTTIVIQDQAEKNHLYFYPSVRKGPLDTSKAENLLNWNPTPWKQTVKETITFYEDAMNKFEHQVNEVIQIVGSQMFGEKEDKSDFYDAIEKLYNIDLKHFRPVKDEL